MRNLFYHDSLQRFGSWHLKVWSMGVKSQKSKYLFISSMWRAITSNTWCSIWDFWNFHWVQALKDIGSEVVLASELSLGPYPLSKNSQYCPGSVWSQWVHVAVGTLGTWGRLVWTPERRQMSHWWLVERALLKDWLFQLHNQGKCKIAHVFILWFLPRFLMFFPFIPTMYGTPCMILI